MLSIVRDARELLIPLLSAMLLGGFAAKFVRILRVGSLDAGLGPTALFPMGLRRPVALAMCVVELGCGVGLLVTARGLGGDELANTIRLATAVLFLVATCALIELRTSHPETGCGCFGDFSTSPVSGRTVARSALLAAAALATIGPQRLDRPQSGAEVGRLLGILLAELVVIAALSPELGEGLVRLGYSEPCELRRLPAVRTLTALRRSSQWRRRAGLITADVPVDMWRELCWRFVAFPARAAERDAEVVFAVYLRPHRPAIHAALVAAVTGEVLAWPALPARRAGPGWSSEMKPAKPDPALDQAPDLAPDLAPDPAPDLALDPAPDLSLDPAPDPDPAPDCGCDRVPDLVGSGVLAAPTDPGQGIPAYRDPPAPQPGEDLALYRSL